MLREAGRVFDLLLDEMVYGPKGGVYPRRVRRRGQERTYHPVPNPTIMPRTTLAILIAFVGVSILPRWSRSASSAIREATNTESRTLG